MKHGIGQLQENKEDVLLMNKLINNLKSLIRNIPYRYIRKAGLWAIIIAWSCLSVAIPPTARAADDCDEAALRNKGIAIVNCIGDTASCDLTGSSIVLTGDDDTSKIFNFLVQHGLTDFQAAGILGNMWAESGIQPQRLQGTASGTITVDTAVPRGQSAKAWGLVQWDPAHKMIDPVRGAGKDPNDLGIQLEFLWGQLTNTWPAGWPGTAPTSGFDETAFGALDAVKASTNVRDATAAFELKYERHAGGPQPERAAKAEEILNSARASGTASGSTGSTTSAGSATTTPTGAAATGSIKDVYILGDSITHGAAAKYNELFSAKNVAVTISAVTSRSWTTAGNPSLGATGTQGTGKAALETDRAAAAKANAIVIALGTNGGLQGNPIDEIISAVRAINASAPIYWVNIASTNSSITPLVDPFNKELAKQQTGGKITAIDWAKVVDPSGPGTSDPSGLLADGTHPKPEGYQKLADLVVNAVLNGPQTGGSGDCSGSGGSLPAGADFAETVKAYAWPDYKGRGFIQKMPAYDTAIEKAKSEGRYVGNNGIDCGGFVTTLMIDSGFEPRYNHNGKMSDGAGNTDTQQPWAQANWQSLGAVTSTADLQPGDVAFQPGHTFVFVGTIPGFNSQMASASNGSRAPMAGHESATGSGVTWFRKK